MANAIFVVPPVTKANDMPRFAKKLLVPFAALCGLALVGAGYQAWAERRDAHAHPMPGKLIDVDGHRLHLRCVGTGTPTVVMIAGAGSPSVNSYDLQDEIAKTSEVCSYDRAGLGWSDPPTRPMGLPQMADDLEKLLARSGRSGPFVLVPESFGGTVALAFAARHPSQVAGIAAVDATEPGLWYRVAGEMNASARTRDRIWQGGWRIGLVRLLLPSQSPEWTEKLSERHRGEFAAVWSRPMPSFVDDFVDAFEQTSPEDVPHAQPGMLGNALLIVISHGRDSTYLDPAFKAGWPDAQRKWLKISSQSEGIIAEYETHMIAQENPALVAEQVARLIALIRQSSREGAETGL